MDITANIGSSAALLAILATFLSFVALCALHLVSPEIRPSWRMVSDYGNGRYSWLLRVVFFTWALSSFALAVAFVPVGNTWLAIAGLLFLVVAGVGEAMGGVFDVNHRLHGVAFGLGVPSLAFAAILLTIAGRQAGLELPLWAAVLPVLSILFMALSIFSLVTSLKSHGLDPRNQMGNLTSLPDGITAWNGWANRILFLAYYLWVVVAALAIRDAGRSL
jgi:hypothetical membrane protein